MKYIVNPLFALVLLLGPVGCQSTSTYKTLATIGISVSSAINQFAELELQGQVTDPELSRRVWDAYNRYVFAYNAAIDVAKISPESPAPADVLKASAAFLDIVEPLILKP